VPNGTLRGVRGRRKSSLLDLELVVSPLILIKISYIYFRHESN